MERMTYRGVDAVKAFHTKNNQLINDLPDKEVSYSCALLRIRLMTEESSELILAMHEKDIIRIADGLADLKYVLYGTAVSYGIALPDQFPDDEDLARIGDIDSNHEEQAMLASRLANFIGAVCKETFLACNSCCPMHSLEFRRATLFEKMAETDMVINEVAEKYGIPLEDIFFNVHESNMSKNLGGTAGEGGKYGEGDDPKGPGYKAPDIEGILNRNKEKTVVN